MSDGRERKVANVIFILKFISTYLNTKLRSLPPAPLVCLQIELKKFVGGEQHILGR